MPVKIDPDIVAELHEMDLTLWEAKHYKRPVLNEKTGKMTMRENKDWVIVSIAGPGVETVQGSGNTLRAAVDSVIVKHFADRVPGIRGKMMILERELWNLFIACMESKYELGHHPESLDDDIPF